jgi:hypothetical protein
VCGNIREFYGIQVSYELISFCELYKVWCLRAIVYSLMKVKFFNINRHWKNARKIKTWIEISANFLCWEKSDYKTDVWLFLNEDFVTYEYRVEGNSFMEQTTSNLLFKEQLAYCTFVIEDRRGQTG